jgi:hypothetical protein
MSLRNIFLKVFQKKPPLASRRGKSTLFKSRRKAHLNVLQLEDRITPTGNITITAASVVDTNDNPLSTVSAGEWVDIQANFRTLNLPSNASYRISYMVNGLSLYTGYLTYGAGASGTGNWYEYWGSFVASPGTNDVTVTIDPDQSVPETTYSDNTLSFTFNATTPSIGTVSNTVAQIRNAYGINGIPDFGSATPDGTGQTIAIVDAFNDPTILSDLDGFDQAMSMTTTSSQNLYQQYGPASSILTVYNQSGTNITADLADSGSDGVPSKDPTGGWEGEETMDVEWAHALAPGAKIDLIETDGQGSFDDLFVGAAAAGQLPGVTDVTMSWIWFEGDWSSSSGELAYDSSTFVTPTGHPGITFLASSGDGGTPGGYPAMSPNVIAVSGTQLTLNNDGYGSETAWSFPTPRTLNNGSSSYSQTGSWTAQSGGFSGTYDTAPAGSNSKATWTTTISSSDQGWVGGTEVSATWTANAGNATNATYLIYNGTPATGTLLGSVTVNQTQAPVGISDGDTEFQELGDYYLSAGSTLSVVLKANSANGTVVADAVGIAQAWATGGGISQYESEPTYQLSVQNTGMRTSPDVAFDGGGNSGVTCYQNGGLGYDYYGTSLSSPCWAGIIAVVNQGRVAAGETTFNSPSNPQQALQALYSLPSSDYNDITSGYNGYSAGPGYDYLTGLGTPIANQLVPDLVSYGLTPTLTGISSAAGPLSGGGTITITGTNFLGATAVEFNGTHANSFTVVNGTTITAVVPAHAVATVDITVTTPGGTTATSSADQYTYVPAPIITAISPSAGPIAGGTVVTIAGTNLANATLVQFGNTAGTINNDTSSQISVTNPAESAGTVTVSVTTAGGTATTSFTYAAIPVITSISPSAGPVAGGTTVTITGTGLGNATLVQFEGLLGTILTDSANQMTVSSPADSTGSVNITVTTAGGTSATSSNDLFNYVPAPTVSSVSPDAGPLDGGTTVTITGTNLNNASVDFGLTPATILDDLNGQIVVADPAGMAGATNVTVTTAGGTASDPFTYVAPPTVTGVSPNAGPLVGGTVVTITGTNLANATLVEFNSIPATVVNDSANQIIVDAPANSVGTADITVTSVGGTSALSSADQFTYAAPPNITAVSPSSGPIWGGTSITISGSNLATATAVEFGSIAATFVIDSATEITATSPEVSAGTVDVTVTTAGGTSNKSAADQFTIIKATPSLAKLSSPTITYGTGSTTVSGTLDANADGQLVPAGETVQVTLNGITQNATLDSNDNFSTAFNASSLASSSTPYTIGFNYVGDDNFNSASGSSTLTVNQANPSFASLSSPTITYGTTSTTISGTLDANAGSQLVPVGETVQVTLDGVAQNATLDSNDNFSTAFNTGSLPSSSTPYTITLSYGGDANFNSASGSSTLAVNQAIPYFAGLSSPTITYGATSTTISGMLNANAGSQPVPAAETVQVTLNGVTQNVTLDSNDNFSATFDTASLAPSASPYTISFSYGGDANFSNAADTSALTVNQAVPTFGSLSSPTITYGTTSTTISGALDANAGSQLVPAGETIQITIDGLTQNATLDNNDDFSAAFDAATLGANGSPYTISFSYGGDANFNAASDSTTLSVNPDTPSFSNLSAPTITYGGASITISGSLDANANGQNVPAGETVQITINGVSEDATLDSNDNFSTTFDTSALEVKDSPYAISFKYTGDANFNAASGGSTLAVSLAAPDFNDLSSPTITYGTVSTTISGTLDANADGQNVPAGEMVQVTFDGVTQNATLDSNDNFSTSFDTGFMAPSSTPYAITFGYGGDADFSSAGGSGTLTVNTAKPTYSYLSSPTIAYGTAGTIISGTLEPNAGSQLIPGGETVQVTLNGVTQNAMLGTNDNFLISFNTDTLGANGSPYTVEFNYAGDADFSGISGGGTLTVNRALPTFSGLTSAPSITQGSAQTIVSGTLNANAGGQNVPAGETIRVTLNGVTQDAPLTSNDSFTTTFATTALTEASGPYPIAIAYAGDNDFGSASGSESLSVTAAPVYPANSLVMIPVNTIQLGGTTSITLQARDPYGNDETTGGLKVAFALANKTGARGTFSPVKDNHNGTYTTIFTGTLDGINAVVATVDTLPVAATASINVEGGKISLAQSIATISAPQITAGTTAIVKLQAEYPKNIDEPAGGLTVAFKLGSASGGQGTFSTVVDHGDGTYTAVFTGTLAGKNTIKAYIDGQAVTSVAPSIKVVTGPISLAKSPVTFSSNSMKADGTVTVTFQPEDAGGNKLNLGSTPLPVFSLESGETITPVDYNAKNGTYSATFTTIVAGSYTIETTYNNLPVTSKSPTINVIPAAVSLANSVLNVSHTSVQSGSGSIVSLRVVDTYGNPEPAGLAVAFRLGNGNGKGTFGKVTYAGNGVYQATFTGTIAGNNAIIAAVGVAKFTSTAAIIVTPGPYSLAKSVVTVAKPGIVVLGRTIIAGGPTIAVFLQTKDAAGNDLTTNLLAEGVSISFELGDSTGAKGTFSAATYLGNGEYEATFTATGVGSNTVLALIGDSKVTSKAPAIEVV